MDLDQLGLKEKLKTNTAKFRIMEANVESAVTHGKNHIPKNMKLEDILEMQSYLKLMSKVKHQYNLRKNMPRGGRAESVPIFV